MCAQLFLWLLKRDHIISTPRRARDIEYLLSALGIKTVVDLRSREEAAGDLGERLLYQYFLDEEEARRITSRAKCDPVDVYVSHGHIYRRTHEALYMFAALNVFLYLLSRSISRFIS